MPSNENNRKEMQDRMAARLAAQRMFIETELPVIRQRGGQAALFRLLPVALSDTGQSSVVARFLLGLYNGKRFPMDITELRRLDRALLVDCLAVLEMDHQPEMEIHLYVENGGTLFEELADRFQ